MKCLGLIALAAAALLAPLSIAHAQEDLAPFTFPSGMGRQQMDQRANMDRDRISNELQGNFQTRDRRGRMLNPGQIMNAAKSAAQASGLSCQVTEAALRGVTPDNNDLWEVACQTGPGYMITSPGKSQPFDCMVLAGQAEQAKADGVELPPTATCVLKGNKNTVAIFAGYAQAAGIPCTVDAGTPLGPDAYEIGCANADGYIIERANGAWTKAPCWRLAASEDSACRLSTAVESNGAWADVLSGSDAAACSVEKARQIGLDSQKLVVYELKCAANIGYLARVNAAGKAERIHACSDPATAGIAGGCILTKP